MPIAEPVTRTTLPVRSNGPQLIDPPAVQMVERLPYYGCHVHKVAVHATRARRLVTQLATLVGRAASWFGSNIAVEDGSRSATFTDVEVRSNRFAHALSTLSPTSGDRIALLIPNRLELVEIDLAIIKAGRVKVPINTRLKHEERAHVIN
ncbi:MAG: AMP-binding protein, partial [Ilumatobacteraceae bacterium]